MRTKKVVVLPYDPAWKAAFEAIRQEIEAAVGQWILAVEHVGSTAVEGMSAKPCIDLDVVIPDYTLFNQVVRGLAEIGYLHEGDLGIPDREAFRCSGKNHLMTHHLYVCPRYSRELHRHITFRNFLRSNPEAAKEYSQVKEQAAKLFPEDIDGYIRYKSPCVAQLYERCGLEDIRAVIFDMYETLVTQFESPLYYGSQIARDLGLVPEDFLPGWRATEEHRATGRLTFEAVMEQLMRKHGIYTPEKHRQVVEKRKAIQRDCFGHLHPGILPMLRGLKERGIRVGLITNCFSEEAELIRESELYPCFDVPCLSWEVGVRKPDPAIYRLCAEKLGVPPEQCLYVGDGGSRELETARELGMYPVQATWYRQDAFEYLQAAIRTEFPQVGEPEDLVKYLRK